METVSGYRFILPPSRATETHGSTEPLDLLEIGEETDTLDREWDLVHVYIHASSIQHNDPALKSSDFGLHDNQIKHITFDVRKFLPQEGLTDMAGLSSRRHDGRHSDIQRTLLRLLFEALETRCHSNGNLQGLGKLLMDILHHIALAMSQGFLHVLIELRCTKGRHRSVGTTMLMCKIMRSLNLRTDALMYDTSTREHATRMCTLCQGHERRGCKIGNTSDTEEQLGALRHFIAENILQGEHFPFHIPISLTHQYETRIELLQCRID